MLIAEAELHGSVNARYRTNHNWGMTYPSDGHSTRHAPEFLFSRKLLLQSPPLPLPSPAAPRDWLRVLRHYRKPSHARSTFEVAITALLFALCWFGSWFILQWGYWLSLIVTIPAAGFLVRLFMIQHDCGHGTLFRHRRLNDWIGRIIGALTLTPYDHWRLSHNVHHASSGNLGHRLIKRIQIRVAASLTRAR